MLRSRRRATFAIVILSSAGTLTGVRGDQSDSIAAGPTGIRALAPVETLASGFDGLSGVAVEASGAVLVTDRAEGTLTRIDVGGNRRRLLADLHGPHGVAVDAAGDVLVLDENGRRLVRLSAGGSLSVVTSALRQARSIAVGPDGRVWVSMRQAADDQSDGDQSGSVRASADVIARLESSGVMTTLAAGFVDVRGIAADASGVYVAMGRLEAEGGRVRTTVARVPVRTDGTAGAVESLLRNTPPYALGVVVDAVGDVFVSGLASDGGDEPAGVIVKRRRSGVVSTLAAGLDDPVAVAFAPNGDLIAADRRLGRVLRFKATLAPVVVAPPFTNQASLTVGGRSIPGGLVQAFRGSDLTGPPATTIADAMSGEFTIQTPLALNTGTRVSFFATAAGGAGLVSTPNSLLIIHDDRTPTVAIVEPSAGVHARDPVALRAHAEDEGSGVASVVFMLDEAIIATVDNPEPSRPLLAVAQLDTHQVAEGPHTLTVVAADRAANAAPAAQLLVVDRTPPDTQIVTGPSEATAERTAIFTFSGADMQSVNLDFAWRLDGSPWSAFSESPLVELTSLPPGMHRFEVTARDRAGNVDPTPAVHTFTVTALLIRILEPAPGAVIATETMWVRGIVESGGPEVTVTVSLPPEFRGELPLGMVPAATEAGTFAAEVPVTSSMTTVTVTARDGQGATSSDAVTIQVQSPLSGSIRLEAFPGAGFAPHTTRFATGTVQAGSLYSLDLDSDGTIDYEGDTLADREFVYARPGIHVATARVTTADGQVLTSRTAVEVYDRTTLEARLRAVWGAFRGALGAGEVARAASFVHSERRATWAEYFQQFTPDLFAATDTVFAEVALLDIGPGRAECEMMREVDGFLYSFPISFLIDADGGWRLWQF